MTETWKPCAGGCYAVSDLGRVRRELPGRSTGAGRLRKIAKGRGGYPSVMLLGKHEFVHRLVAIAFLGPVPPGKEVNHINGDRTDARAVNLEYVTPSENCKHAYRLGLNRPPTVRRSPPKGQKNGRAKLTEAQVRLLREKHAAGVSIKELVAEFGVGKSNVDYIARRVAWSHVA